MEEKAAPMLSIGLPSTLGNWHRLVKQFFGAESEATKYLEDKIAEQGADEPVVADEGQMMYLMVQFHQGKDTA